MKTFGPDEDSKDCEGEPFDEEEEPGSEALENYSAPTIENISRSTAVCNKRNNKVAQKLNSMIAQNLIAH